MTHGPADPGSASENGTEAIHRELQEALRAEDRRLAELEQRVARLQDGHGLGPAPRSGDPPQDDTDPYRGVLRLPSAEELAPPRPSGFNQPRISSPGEGAGQPGDARAPADPWEPRPRGFAHGGEPAL